MQLRRLRTWCGQPPGMNTPSHSYCSKCQVCTPYCSCSSLRWAALSMKRWLWITSSKLVSLVTGCRRRGGEPSQQHRSTLLMGWGGKQSPEDSGKRAGVPRGAYLPKVEETRALLLGEGVELAGLVVLQEETQCGAILPTHHVPHRTPAIVGGQLRVIIATACQGSRTALPGLHRISRGVLQQGPEGWGELREGQVR